MNSAAFLLLHAACVTWFGPVLLLPTTCMVSCVVGCRVVIAARRLRRHSGEHAAAIRMVGRGGAGDLVVVEAPQPLVYCVAGRLRTVVVTTAALDTLSERQLAAVLAHEHAHLRGGHHRILLFLRALAASLPRMPIFPASVAAVGRLLEMCADDAAVRTHGSAELLGGLVALAAPPSKPQQWRGRASLSAVIALSTVTPLLAGFLCHP